MTRRWAGGLPAGVGVLAGAGPAHPLDLQAFERCRLNLIRLRVGVNPAEDVGSWRDAGASMVILQLLSPLPSQAPTSPGEFVEAFSSEIARFLDQGVRYLEVHDEPNRVDRGAGISWQDGAAFAAWFREVAARLRDRFGDAVKLGFPALAPSRLPRPDPSAPVDDLTFLEPCRDALAEADWAALHLYWRTVEEMRAFDGPLQALRMYLEPFADQDFIVTEFANVNPELASTVRGDQYAEFYTTMAQYDRILGVCGFLLHAEDPRYAPLAWLDADGHPRAMVARIADRPAMPDPYRLWMTWPTEYPDYNQFFGENQRTYYDCCRMAGGHNGVDLRVDFSTPEDSPIWSALPGTVVQVALDETGYGHHLRVRSYGPIGEEITLIYAHLSGIVVSTGMLVERGDLLGWAGSTGWSTGPHLHLGMRIAGIHNPAIFDWLNPLPYLESQPRGVPREAYARTYVLLPPGAGADWAAAVVRGSWATHRFTVGGSADDAGIGALDLRRVIAVNPGRWSGDLAAFFAEHYPGVIYVPVSTASPEALEAWLASPPPLPARPPEVVPSWPFGLPRAPYDRTYLLLPPGAGPDWALAAVHATWDRSRFTVGGSADDAGIGDLDARRVLAVNPEAWPGDLEAFFAAHYPGVAVVPLRADTPEQLVARLRDVMAAKDDPDA